MTHPALVARKLALIESCNMAGFRNVLVHGYDDVDLAVVRDVLGNHLGDLEEFVEAVRQNLGRARTSWTALATGCSRSSPKR